MRRESTPMHVYLAFGSLFHLYETKAKNREAVNECEWTSEKLTWKHCKVSEAKVSGKAVLFVIREIVFIYLLSKKRED